MEGCRMEERTMRSLRAGWNAQDGEPHPQSHSQTSCTGSEGRISKGSAARTPEFQSPLLHT